MLNEKITAIIPKDLIDRLSAEYKAKRLKAPTRRPQLFKLFNDHGITRKAYDQILGLMGGPDQLHYFLAKDIDVEADSLNQLLQITIKEAQDRLPKMTNREFIDLMKVLGELTGEAKPNQQTNINFDMNSYLAGRLND